MEETQVDHFEKTKPSNQIPHQINDLESTKNKNLFGRMLLLPKRFFSMKVCLLAAVTIMILEK